LILIYDFGKEGKSSCDYLLALPKLLRAMSNREITLLRIIYNRDLGMVTNQVGLQMFLCVNF